MCLSLLHDALVSQVEYLRRSRATASERAMVRLRATLNLIMATRSNP